MAEVFENLVEIVADGVIVRVWAAREAHEPGAFDLRAHVLKLSIAPAIYEDELAVARDVAQQLTNFGVQVNAVQVSRHVDHSIVGCVYYPDWP